MIMKLVTTDNRVLMTILVIASIGGTLVAVQGFGLVNYQPQSPLSTGGSMLTGNVKVFQYDKDGNIIAYRQSDNHIVKDGLEIVMAQVFRGINTTTYFAPSPTKGLPHPVQYMQIGTGQEIHRLLHNDTDISVAIPTCTTRAAATITNSSASHGYHTTSGLCNDTSNICNAQMNVTAVAQFQGSAGCNVNSIDEAGIYDNVTGTTTGMYQTGVLNQPNGGGYMFARNTFGSVNLGPLDTLQLQWEFTFTDS